ARPSCRPNEDCEEQRKADERCNQADEHESSFHLVTSCGTSPSMSEVARRRTIGPTGNREREVRAATKSEQVYGPRRVSAFTSGSSPRFPRPVHRSTTAIT